MKQLPNFTKGMFEADTILKNLCIKKGSVILDGGCGNGYMLKEFSLVVKNEGRVYGIDKNIDFVNSLNKNNSLENVEILTADLAKRTTFKDEFFDLIYLSTVLHIFTKEEKEGFFSESSRLLKKGGILAIVEVDKKDSSFGPPLTMRITPDELIKIVPLKPKELIELNENFYMQIFEK